MKILLLPFSPCHTIGVAWTGFKPVIFWLYLYETPFPIGWVFAEEETAAWIDLESLDNFLKDRKKRTPNLSES